MMTSDQSINENLKQIVSCLSASDNSLRSNAEQTLQAEFVNKRPQELLAGLCNFMRHAEDATFRGFCAILFRRFAFRAKSSSLGEKTTESEPLLWEKVPDCHDFIKQELLLSLRDEKDKSVRRLVSEVIGALSEWSISGQTGMPDKWPELLPTLFECVQSPNPLYRESVFYILALVPSLLFSSNFKFIDESFNSGLQDSNGDVRLSCLKAAVQVLLSDDHVSDNNAASKQKLASSWIVPISNILVPLKEENNEDNLVEVLTNLSVLFESYPKCAKLVIVSLVPFLCDLISDSSKSLMDKTRHSALEVLVTLAEGAPGLCRKMKTDRGLSFASMAIPPVLKMMSEVDDDPSWYTTEKIDEFDESDSNNIVGETAIDRLSRALGGKFVLPAIFSCLPAMISSNMWNERFAALMCISSMAEGCYKIMKPELNYFVEMVVSRLNDPHARVRYAACNAIGQLCTDFAPDIQDNYKDPILSGLVQAIDNDSMPRVQAHAAAAVVNFLEEAENLDISPYMDSMVSILGKLLSSAKLYVKQQAVTTLATLANSAGTSFSKYHSAVTPVLLQILLSAQGNENRLLKGKIIECVSLIGLSVGNDLFKEYSHNFLSLLKNIQDNITDDDDPQSSYLITSWARICKVLGGKDFHPYVPYVLPPLIKSAKIVPEYAVLDLCQDFEEKGFNSEDGWEFVTIKNQTSSLEEKCTAVEMLVCYARELGPFFAPYVDDVLKFSLPLLRFYFHDGVRIASAALMPFLLTSLKSSSFSNLNSVWYNVCSELLRSIKEESEMDVLRNILASLYDCLEIMGENSLVGAIYQVNKVENDSEESYNENEPILTYFCEAVVKKMSEIFKKILERDSQRHDSEFYDAEVEENLEEEEEYEIEVLANMSKVIQYIFKSHKMNFWPSFTQVLLQPLSGMLFTESSSKSFSQTVQWAICVLDDVIEFLGAGVCWEIRNSFWTPFMKSIIDQKNPDNRQAASYGIGLLAIQVYESGDLIMFNNWFPNLKDALSLMLQSLEQDFSYHEDHYLATDNVISAIGKIMRFCVEPLLSQSSEMINLSDYEAVLSLWIKHLPLKADEEEAPHVASYLLMLLEKKNQVVLNQISRVCFVLTKVLRDNLILQSELYPQKEALQQEITEKLKKIWTESDGTFKQNLLQEMIKFEAAVAEFFQKNISV